LKFYNLFSIKGEEEREEREKESEEAEPKEERKENLLPKRRRS